MGKLVVTEFVTLDCPVVLGEGKRLFPDGADTTSLKLVEAKQTGAVALLTLSRAS